MASRVKKPKLNICKSKGCQSEPLPDLNYCKKHWWPCDKPEDRIVGPLLRKAMLKHYTEKDEQRRKDGLVHVSDINLCMREKVFQHLKPEPLTPIKLKWFSTGNAIHHKLQMLVDQYPEWVKEYPVRHKNITAHIDMYNTKLNLPVEAKSMNNAGIEVPKNFHIDQLKMYMALVGADIGVYFIDPLLNFTEDPNAEWTVRMNQNERAELLKVIETKAELYAKAMEEQNPAIASHIAYDPEYNWHCDYCQYATECEKMRTQERAMSEAWQQVASTQ